MATSRRVLAGALAVVALGVTIYPGLDAGEGFLSLWYDGCGLGAIGIALAGLRVNRPVRPKGWALLLAGYAGWVFGDLWWLIGQPLMPDMYPAPPDIAYLASYGLVSAGVLVLVRGRRSGRDPAAVLDAATIATGAGVLIVVLLIAPMTRNSDASMAAKIVGASYPVGDIFLFGVLMRMWTAAGARTACYRLLTASLLVTAGADIAWALLVGRAGDLADHRWTDTFWLIGYLLMAAAMVVPSMRAVTESPAEPELETPTVRRLVALAGGLVLPPVTLLVDGANGGAIEWATIGIGSIAMSLLVLIRMAGLLGTVQVQAVRLSGLARSDPLTGAPNRRSWDFELSRTCQTGREQQAPVCIAMVDLDHFKSYNDTHGHQAGDRLLREAVAAWTEQLGPDGFIARYGGEEFAVLFCGVSVETAVERIRRLGAVTPGGQTFSAGVAQWDPATDPSLAVGWADAALYDAKRAGRNRVSVNPSPGGDPTAPSLVCSATTRPELGTSPR